MLWQLDNVYVAGRRLSGTVGDGAADADAALRAFVAREARKLGVGVGIAIKEAKRIRGYRITRIPEAPPVPPPPKKPTQLDLNIESVVDNLLERDDLGQLNIPPSGKRYARMKGKLGTSPSKFNLYAKMVADLTGQSGVKGFKSKDTTK